MKTRSLWWGISLVLIVAGGVAGGLWANYTYRPDQTWGDLRVLAVAFSAVTCAVLTAIVIGLVVLLANTFRVALKANGHYSQLPPSEQAQTSREVFVLRPVLKFLAPFLTVVCLIIGNHIFTRWQIARNANPWRGGQRLSVTPTVAPLPTQDATASSSGRTNPGASLGTSSATNVTSAQKVWGDLWYANATILPLSQPSPRPDVPFALMMLTSSDRFEAGLKYYKARLPVVNEQANNVIFRGPRGDGRTAIVSVRRYANNPLLYISLSSQ